MIIHSKIEGAGCKNTHAPQSWPRPETAACNSSVSSIILLPPHLPTPISFHDCHRSEQMLLQFSR